MTHASIAAPATTGEVADRVHDAAARGAALRIAGRGHWLDAGRPITSPGAAQPLALAALDGITEYVPGDLALTARAATSLADIARAAAAHRQWLTLDPPGSDDGSLGATVATASAGPLAHAFGTPRDHVLGLEAVTGDGRIVHTGGRVVKNVAGFDLTRLFTGSWGTLAVITEITVRLRAMPEADASCALPAPRDPPALAALLHRVRRARIAPLAVELVNAALARHLGLESRDLLLIRLAGNEDSVRAQRDAVATVGDVAPVDAAAWLTLRTAEPDAAAVVRLSREPSRTADTWADARAIISNAAGAFCHASVGRGIVRCIVPGTRDATLAPVLDPLAAFDGTVIIERLPAAAWPRAARPAPNAELAARAKAVFDPRGVLNPGIMGLAS